MGLCCRAFRIKYIIPAGILFLFSFLGSSFKIYSQDSPTVTDVDTISTFAWIENPVAGYINRDFNIEKDYNETTIYKYRKKERFIPYHFVTWKLLNQFTLINSGDLSKSCYYFPGFYYSNTLLYRIKDGKATPLPVIAPDHRDSVSYRLITVPAMDTITVLAVCTPIRTYVSSLRPRIIDENYIGSYIVSLKNTFRNEALYTFILAGILLTMILLSLSNYFLGGRREFIYYAAYAFFIGFMLSTKVYFDFRSNHRSFFYEEYLDFILQGLGFCFYMAFMMRFLETKNFHPFLHKLYTVAISFVILCLGIYSYLHFATYNFAAETTIENYIAKGVLLLLVVVFLVYAVRHWKFVLLRYLFWGNFLFFVFSTINLLKVLNPSMINLPKFFETTLMVYETGVILELIVFLAALVYKDRTQLIEQVKVSERLTMENERKEMEKQVAVMAAHQEERERISADMHDELGSGITTIRLMSEIAKNKMKEKVPGEIEKISNSANDLLNKMNAIIWSMNSSNDTVDNLVSYIRSYTIEYLEGTSVQCRMTIPDQIEPIDISGDKRRNFFLCVKETLNNILKHAQATEVKMTVSVTDALTVSIADNGIGFDPNGQKGFGNGLKNMKRRMNSIGGSVNILSNNGTETIFSLPL